MARVQAIQIFFALNQCERNDKLTVVKSTGNLNFLSIEMNLTKVNGE